LEFRQVITATHLEVELAKPYPVSTLCNQTWNRQRTEYPDTTLSFWVARKTARSTECKNGKTLCKLTASMNNNKQINQQNSYQIVFL